MPYLFTCPHCQSKTRVEDRYSGKTGECFTCGQPIELPQFAAPTALPSPSSAPTGQKRSASMLVAAGAVVVLLLCLVFAVVRFGGSGVSRLAEIRLQKASIKNLESIASALNT